MNSFFPAFPSVSRTARISLLSIFSVFLAGWLGLALTNAAGTFTATGSMSVPRYVHTATLLPNGTVLVAGGGSSSTAEISAEIYNPATGMFSATGRLTTAREAVTATALIDGTVLFTGGTNNASGGAPLASAETYDPATGMFSATSSTMSQPRRANTATLLGDGTVLVAGGANDNSGTIVSATADIYNLVTRSFSTAPGAMTTPRYGHTATRLSSGKVLIAGGNNGGVFLATAELYDPTTGTFSGTAGALITPRADHTATLLPNGKVLIAGGFDGNTVLASAELYDPTTQTFSNAGSMTVPRAFHAATALSDGRALITGGAEGCCWVTGTSAADIYDPVAGFSSTGNMISPRVYHASTPLADGSILITGGQGAAVNTSDVLATAELFTVGSSASTKTGMLAVTTNLSFATFTIVGPASYNGSGTSFTVKSAPAGTYKITYREVAGYATPASDTQTLTGGGSITFNGNYISRPACTYSLSSTSESFGATEGVGTFTVTTAPTCAWSPTTTASNWITFLPSVSGSSCAGVHLCRGTGTVSFHVTYNPGTSARTGTIVVADQTFTVHQQGAPCSFSINPTSVSSGPSGGDFVVAVSGPSICRWTASSSVQWITVIAGAQGSGNGSVKLRVSANTTASGRTGSATIAGRSFSIKQDAVLPCGATDVTSQMQIQTTGLNYISGGYFQENLKVKNISQSFIPGPIWIVLVGLPNQYARVVGNQTLTTCFSPHGDYFLYDWVGLQPGQTSDWLPAAIPFYSPSSEYLQFSIKVLSGRIVK